MQCEQKIHKLEVYQASKDRHYEKAFFQLWNLMTTNILSQRMHQPFTVLMKSFKLKVGLHFVFMQC